MARAQQSPFDIGGATGFPLGSWRARGSAFSVQAALITRLLFRKDVGFRILSWTNITVTTIGMLVLNWISNIHLSLFTLFGGGVLYDDNTSLRNFALAWMGLAVWEHFKRLDEEKQGTAPHTQEPGISRFGLEEFLPVSPKWITRAVEPGLAFLAGAVLRRFGFSMLGWVIIASSVCFSLSEWRLSQQAKDHLRDIGDIGKEAHWQAQAMKARPEHRPAQTGSDPIDTGVAGLGASEVNRRQTNNRTSASTGGAL